MGLSCLKDFFFFHCGHRIAWQVRRVDQTNLLPPIVQLLYFFQYFVLLLISWTLKHV